jgi:DNA-directed RNA polymerase specialized sigma subunit
VEIVRGSRLSPERERELVVGTERGDKAACRELVDSFMPAIDSIVRRFEPVRDSDAVS